MNLARKLELAEAEAVKEAEESVARAVGGNAMAGAMQRPSSSKKKKKKDKSDSASLSPPHARLNNDLEPAASQTWAAHVLLASRGRDKASRTPGAGVSLDLSLPLHCLSSALALPFHALSMPFLALSLHFLDLSLAGASTDSDGSRERERAAIFDENSDEVLREAVRRCLCLVFPLPSLLRHRLCIMFPLPSLLRHYLALCFHCLHG